MTTATIDWISGVVIMRFNPIIRMRCGHIGVTYSAEVYMMTFSTNFLIDESFTGMFYLPIRLMRHFQSVTFSALINRMTSPAVGRWIKVGFGVANQNFARLFADILGVA